MAKRTVVQYVDDLDGTDIKAGKGGPVAFSLEGTDYSIDLSEKNATALRRVLEPYITKAEKVSKSRTAASRRSSANTGEVSAQLLRAWARSNGFEVPDRGRIPQAIRDAYNSKN